MIRGMLPAQSVVACLKFDAFCKMHRRRVCSLFASTKREQKAPATFEAREAAGCGSLRLLCALDGTRILQAAAPTAPPCFGHWPRSSPLQTRGYTPLVTPKKMGSIQKIQAAPLKDFLCSADFKAPQPLLRQLPAGAGALVSFVLEPVTLPSSSLP